MGKIIKVRCNGSNQHVNEIDLDDLLRTTTVLKGSQPKPDIQSLPERFVRPCKVCAEGKVNITREMIEKTLKA